MTVSVTELKARLSEQLRKVKRGEVVLVTERGRVIARLMPAEPVDDDERLVALERAGLVRRGTGGLPEELLEAPGPADPTASVRAAVQAERESGW